MDAPKKISWLERVEDIVQILEGSTIAELELTETGTEIVIRREPGMVLVSTPASTHNVKQAASQATDAARPARVDQGIAIIAPLTGVYYSAASPTSPPFASVGDIIQVGQAVALIEAMKVFNEIQAEVSGRVLTMVATNGSVVRKGDVLLRIETL